jgi:hypothetical protein
MGIYIIIAVVALCSTIVLVALFRSVLRAGASVPQDRAWLDEFSIDKYRPMLRLLSERDFEYLALQSGFTPDIARRLRQERRRIFRAYLRNLNRDFNRLHAAARELVAQAPEDRSALASALFTYQVTFLCAIVAVHLRLMLYIIGIGTVDVRRALNTLESFRVEIAAAMTPASNFA